MHVVDVEMNHVELIGAFQNFLKHHKVMRQMVGALVAIEPQ